MKKKVNIVWLFWKVFESAKMGSGLEGMKIKLAVWVNQRSNGCERGRLKIGLVTVITLVSAYLLWVILTAFD